MSSLFFFSFIFRYHFLDSGFYFIFHLFSPSSLREKIRRDRHTKYEPMSIYLLCVYSISEIWENKFETFLFLCCLLKTFPKESIFHYTRFLDSERKNIARVLYLYCIVCNVNLFLFAILTSNKVCLSFVLLYKRDRIRIILKCNDFTHLRLEKVEISSF